MPELRTTYKCEDGSDFPVIWEDPRDPDYPWLRNGDHYPLVAPPLEVALIALGQAGRERAFSDAGIPCGFPFRKEYVPNGFVYLRGGDFEGDELERWREGTEVLEKSYRGNLGVWEDYCLPRIRELCGYLQTADAGVPLADLADAWGYSFCLTQVAAAVLRRSMARFRAFLVAETGEEGERTTHDLMQGQPNATIDADQAMWQLAQHPALRSAMAKLTEGEALRLDGVFSAPGGADFRRAFDGFIEEFGWRSESWQLAARTWREDRETVLSLVRKTADSRAASPAETQGVTKRRGSDLAAAVRERLEPGKRAPFDALLSPLASYTTIREGRAFWQLTGDGSLRHAVLQRGARLAESGVVGQADDIWFLLPDEIEAEIRSANLRELIEHRRKEHAYWSTKTPPPSIGAAPPPGAPGLAPGRRDGATIRGIGASRGVVSGHARVILDLADADRLQKGDVLVTVMTAPPWTPLFGVASAIVTDTGGLLSHPSIAAREYGIPCVVGARTATIDIPDGAMVTVDGESGTVRLG